MDLQCRYPLQAHADGLHISDESTAFAGQLVILVEDEPDILFALSLLLQGWGLRTLEARSLEDLSSRLGQTTDPASLVITDYYLPGGATGREVVDRVRSHSGGGPVPAIVLTGDTASERVAEAAALGYRLLLKPVQPEDLERAIHDMLRGA